MMNVVVSFTRVEKDGVHTSDVQVDPGGGPTKTVEHTSGAGDDAQPLAGDRAITVEVQGSGKRVVIAYMDPKNAGVAAAGERRLYSRDEDGAIKATVWLKADGSLELTNENGSIVMGADGVINLNGVTIDTDGNVSAPGEVTAKSGSPASVGLTTHMHPDAMGGTGAPTAGT